MSVLVVGALSALGGAVATVVSQKVYREVARIVAQARDLKAKADVLVK